MLNTTIVVGMSAGIFGRGRRAAGQGLARESDALLRLRGEHQPAPAALDQRLFVRRVDGAECAAQARCGFVQPIVRHASLRGFAHGIETAASVKQVKKSPAKNNAVTRMVLRSSMVCSGG
jgi:hypothetical protein